MTTMADVYATITTADRAVQERLADVLERRAGDIQQQEMLRSYLADIYFPDGAEVLELGCGTGAVSRVLARYPGVGRVVAIDPSRVFLTMARNLSPDFANLTFAEGDCRSLPYGENCFDVLVFHTTLSHIPGPEAALTEAFRLLRPGGVLAIFDGNYTTTTLATGDHDPLQACADAAMAALVHDRRLIQRLPSLVRQAGFSVVKQRSLGIVETTEPDYMLSIADRGADVLTASGRISADLAQALKNEARRRVAEGCFFGAITYGSLVAHKMR
jgi:ubiquinone/menaquinone biosynthesis C-methylase UbiE